MLFEVRGNNHKFITFEVDAESGFHEKIIACNALGILTLDNADKPKSRIAPALVASKINKLQYITNESKNPRDKKPQNITMRIRGDELEVLKNALELYIDSTRYAIKRVFSPENPQACNVRALEGHLAANMLAVLNPDQARLTQKTPFGFSAD